MTNPDELDDIPIPQAKPEFQQRLEEVLLARLQEKGKPKMMSRPVKHFSPPLPLIAAILCLIVVFNIAMLMRNAPLLFQITPPAPADGCGTHYARITEPANGAQIMEPTSIKGTAYLDDGEFGMYVLQIKGEDTGNVYEGTDWHFSTSRYERTLFYFDPYRYPAGDYRLQLTVHDEDGKMHDSCTINISIVRPDLGVPTVDIVIAKHFIKAGAFLSEDNLAYRSWPETSVPLSAMIDIDQVAGQFARTDIYPESPIQGNIIGARPDLPNIDVTQMIEVAVAIQPITRGQTITADMVGLRTWPLHALPPRAFTDLNELIGRTAWTDVYREQPITHMMIEAGEKTTGIPVVTAKNLIPRGQLITPEMVTVTFWDQSEAPEDTFTSIDEAVGQVAVHDIPAYTAVLSNLITQNLNNLEPAIPDGKRLISLPLDDQVFESIEPGDYINVYRTEAGDGDVLADEPTVDAVLLAQNALVISRTDFSQSQQIFGEIPEAGQKVISLAVLPQEAVDLTGAVGAGTPLIITKQVSSTPVILCQVVAVSQHGVMMREHPTSNSRRLSVLPFGTSMDVLSQQRGENDNNRWFYVSVQMNTETAPIEGWVQEENVNPLNLSVCPPLDGDMLFTLPLALPENLLNAETRLEVGDTVDIVVALMYFNAEENSTPVPPTTPNLQIQRMVRGVKVAAVNNEEITLTVSPQEKVTLDYLKESNIPLILIPMD